MKNNEFEYAVEQMRNERHDFMNYLQVIYGYIQIKKPYEAENYIKEINNKMLILSQIFNLECPYFAIIMQDFIARCNKFNIIVDFFTELEYISTDVFSKNIDDKRNIMYKIIDVLADTLSTKAMDSIKIYVNLAGTPDNIDLIIGNNEELVYDGDFEGMKAQSFIQDNENKNYVNIYKDDSNIVFVIKYENK